jgi:hypothetical protein
MHCPGMLMHIVVGVALLTCSLAMASGDALFGRVENGRLAINAVSLEVAKESTAFELLLVALCTVLHSSTVLAASEQVLQECMCQLYRTVESFTTASTTGSAALYQMLWFA